MKRVGVTHKRPVHEPEEASGLPVPTTTAMNAQDSAIH